LIIEDFQEGDSDREMRIGLVKYLLENPTNSQTTHETIKIKYEEAVRYFLETVFRIRWFCNRWFAEPDPKEILLLTISSKIQKFQKKGQYFMVYY
jgi:hypothetical protein